MENLLPSSSKSNKNVCEDLVYRYHVNVVFIYSETFVWYNARTGNAGSGKVSCLFVHLQSSVLAISL